MASLDDLLTKGASEKNNTSVTSITSLPLKFLSLAKSSSNNLGEVPTSASCTAFSPVIDSQVGISRSNLIREEPMKTVAFSFDWYASCLLLAHSTLSSL